MEKIKANVEDSNREKLKMLLKKCSSGGNSTLVLKMDWRLIRKYPYNKGPK